MKNLWILIHIFVCWSLGTAINKYSLFTSLTNESIYKVQLRPDIGKGVPIVVNVSMHFYNLASLDERHTEYTIQLLLRQYWIDPRLAFNDTDISIIDGDHWHAEKIWQPTLHIQNNKELGAINKVGRGAVMVQIKPNGQVLLSKQAQLKLFCYMNFKRYPLDTQVCKLELESSTLDENHLILQWHLLEQNKAVNLGENFHFSGFQLCGEVTVQKTHVEYAHTGNFSKLVVNFKLEREFTLFLIEIYVPSCLIVITSWTSFWIDITGAPARVSLGITTMLTLVTSVKTARDQLPRFAYVNALDIWIVGCIGFIFASLIEYSMVNYIYYKDKNRRRRKSKRGGRKRRNSGASQASRGSLSSSADSVFTVSGNVDAPKTESCDNHIEFMRSVSRESNFSTPSSPTSPTTPQLLIPPTLKNRSKTAFNNAPEITITATEPPTGENTTTSPKLSMHLANSIDKKCRFIFPLCFIIFNILYWTIVKTLSD